MPMPMPMPKHMNNKTKKYTRHPSIYTCIFSRSKDGRGVNQVSRL